MRAEIEKLEEENKKLKDNVEFLHSCLDDRDKSIQYAEEENKKLKENISWYEKEEDRLRGENRKLKNSIEELEKEIEELNKMMLFETKI